MGIRVAGWRDNTGSRNSEVGGRKSFPFPLSTSIVPLPLPPCHPATLPPLVLVLLLCGLAGATAQQIATPAASPALDPACIRFDDPNAVIDGEVPFVGFTAYRFALDHATDAWSPQRGFAIELREVPPVGNEVPVEANLIYRDVNIPGAGFKGVTVTWHHAPATITLNRAALPPPHGIDPAARDLIRSVMTHETGHALGLGDVPAPGVNIRECGDMLMKRSVDKAGGHILEPQPGDIALYCMRWGGAVCGDNPPPTIATMATPASEREARGVIGTASPSAASHVTYRYLVVKCEQLPASAITPEQIERGDLPADPPGACARVPAGVLFQVHLDDGGDEVVMTNRRGELSFQKPDGVAVDVIMPEGRGGNFPSLLGYQPAENVDHIPASDPACPPGTAGACKRVYVLVPESG